MKTKLLQKRFQIALVAILSFSSTFVFSQESISIGRSPANFIADEDLAQTPTTQEIWIKSAMKEDDAGVLSSMRSDISNWQERENFVKQWNLRPSGLYSVTSDEDRKNSINSRWIQYADKRLSGELKNAEKGSTMAQVATVHKALKPQSTVQVSPNYKLKFQARVLQRTAVMRLENPFFDCNAQFNLGGQVNMHIGKDLSEVGIKTNVDYDVKAGRYIASMDKDLGYNFSTRLSSSQSDKQTMFNEAADKKLEIMYNLPF